MTVELYDSLDEQVVLVAGAEGGAGAAIVGELAARGATVYVGSADGTAPPWSIPLELDMGDIESVGAAIGRIVDDRDGLDVLVLLPGVADTREWNLLEATVDAIDEGLARNLRGPLLLVRAALPYLLERDGARIITVTTDWVPGKQPVTAAVHVPAAGLQGLTTYLDAAFAPRLIANSVTPGTLRTDGGHTDPTESSAKTVGLLARLRPGSAGGQVWQDCETVGV